MWVVAEIVETDFGCEERMPGEPLMVMVTLESEDGRRIQFEIPDEWLRTQDINEGDEWPEDLDEIELRQEWKEQMAAFMDNYFEAVAEMLEGEENS